MEARKSKKGHKRDIKLFKFDHGEIVLTRDHSSLPPSPVRGRIIMRRHQRTGFNIYRVRNLETMIVYDYGEQFLVRSVVQEVLRERSADLSPALSAG